MRRVLRVLASTTLGLVLGACDEAQDAGPSWIEERGMCVPAVGDYGACEAELGYAFVGNQCLPVSGCDCGDDCDAVFSSALECAQGCWGNCSDQAVDWSGPPGGASGTWSEATHCELLAFCVEPSAIATVEELFGRSCDADLSFECDTEDVVPCVMGTDLLPVGKRVYAAVCAADTLPEVTQLECVVPS